MKRIIAFVLTVAALASLCVSLGACSLIHVKDGFYFTEEYDENDELIGYSITGGSKKTMKKEKLVFPSEIRGLPVIKVTAAWDGGFEGCLAKEIIIPEGVTKIVGGFDNCPNLTTVDLPDSLEIMMNDVFKGSPNVGTVENGFRYVDGWVVSRESGDTHILRDDTVGVADYVKLDGIQDSSGNVHFPEGMRYIGDCVFEESVIPGDVTIPTTVKNMGWSLFENAQIGGTLTFPKEITHMYNNILNRTNVTRVVLNCTNLYFDNCGWDGVFPRCTIGELVVNSSIITYHEEHNEDGMFNANINKLITRAEVLPYLPAAPKTLEVTGGAVTPGAFKQYNIEALILDEGVLSVGDTAFAGCTNLKSLTVKNANLTLGKQAFYQTGITTVTAPASVIGTLPTSACTELVVTAGTVTADTLKGASTVTELTLHSGVTAVAEGALASLTALKTATVPAKYVGELPKAKLEKLSITGGSTLESTALAGAMALTEVRFGTSITAIGENTFADAAALKAVHYSGTVADWAKISFANAAANPLYHAKSLYVNNAVVIEAIGLNTVSNYAFAGYKALAYVTFGENATKIGTSAFAGCTGLTALTLPASLFEIGKGAFADCTGITEVTFGDTTGWYRFESADATTGNQITEYYLSDAPRAAGVLTGTYADYVWRNIG